MVAPEHVIPSLPPRITPHSREDMEIALDHQIPEDVYGGSLPPLARRKYPSWRVTQSRYRVSVVLS